MKSQEIDILSAIHKEFWGFLSFLIIIVFSLFFNKLKQKIEPLLTLRLSLKASELAKIHNILRKCLYRTEADRASVFKFSGGIISTDNKSLIISCLNEVVEDGIAPSIYDRKHLNVKEFGQEFLETLLEKDVYIITNVTELSLLNPVLSGFFISQNTQYAGIQLIQDSAGEIYGFVLVEFCRNYPQIDKPFFLEELRFCKDKLSLLI